MGGDNWEKLPLQNSLNQYAISRAAGEIERTGKFLPASVLSVDGAIVTVKFEVQSATFTIPSMTVPKGESAYFRAPTQEGDLGMCMSADTYLGAMSGLGGGTANLDREYGNLSSLVWVPVGNVAFAPLDDPNKAFVMGPNGFTLQDPDGIVSIVGDKTTGTITITAGAQTIVITQDPSVTTTVQGALGPLTTIVDGNGNTISQIVPLVGGKIFLGAQNLTAIDAALTQGNLATFATGAGGLIENTLPKLMAAVGGAIGATSSTWATAQPLLAAIFAAANFVPNIAGIAPSIPAGSTTVFIRP